jgi:uncharacterized protein
VWATTDQWHAGAERAFERLAQVGPALTTTFALLECGSAAARRPYRDAVDTPRGELDRAGLPARPADDDGAVAREAYRRGGPGSAGIVDHVSLRVMQRPGVTDALTDDAHFPAAGLRTLSRRAAHRSLPVGAVPR